MSSLCITKGADVFSSAIAVAPVTNWRYYDNIYTERFMRTPQENGENYDINSPINHVDTLKGKAHMVLGSKCFKDAANLKALRIHEYREHKFKYEQKHKIQIQILYCLCCYAFHFL